MRGGGGGGGEDRGSVCVCIKAVKGGEGEMDKERRDARTREI